MSGFGFAAVLLLCVWTSSTQAQSASCKGRCGMGYYRGNTCQCDYSCLRYGECCKDFERQCTSKSSCLGRCGEGFKRGRSCDCDPDCVKFNHCCPDYEDQCNDEEEVNGDAPVKPDSCDSNVVHEKNPADGPLSDITEQPLGPPLSEGNDPGDSLIPTVNPTAVQSDDPGSAPQQVSDVNPPEPIPPAEGASGFGSTPSDLLEDFTVEPPLPDLDGFEIPPDPESTASATDPESTTSATDPESTASATDPESTDPESTTSVTDPDSTASVTDPESTDPESTTGATDETQTSAPVPSTEQVTGNTDADDSTTDPTSDLVSNQPTAESTTATADANPTDPKATANPTQMDEDRTTATTAPASSEMSETSKTEQTTISPTTVARETTPNADMASTDPNPSTLDPAKETELSTAAAVKPEVEESSATASDTTPASTTETTTKPSKKPRPENPLNPVQVVDNKPVLNGLDDLTEYPADDSNDQDLCSGRPIGGATTLSNGTVVIFRGHFFWVLDRNRVPGPAQGITQVWGVPSPIDTVFTRCNCQGKTYLFKGPRYWRFENDVLDPGFPKLIETGFDGLRGQITAALSVPQFNQRRESVYFFKRGGNVQKYSYQYGTNPSCGRRLIFTHRTRVARQAAPQVSLLGPTINYRSSWRGFPTAITAAVSIPNKREPEGYNYYVFSRAKSYQIRIASERPVIAAPKPSASTQSNEVFKCPKKNSKAQAS